MLWKGNSFWYNKRVFIYLLLVFIGTVYFGFGNVPTIKTPDTSSFISTHTWVNRRDFCVPASPSGSTLSSVQCSINAGWRTELSYSSVSKLVVRVCFRKNQDLTQREAHREKLFGKVNGASSCYSCWCKRQNNPPQKAKFSPHRVQDTLLWIQIWMSMSPGNTELGHPRFHVPIWKQFQENL